MLQVDLEENGENEVQRTFERDGLRGGTFPFGEGAAGLGVGFAAAASADAQPRRNTASQMTERMMRDAFVISGFGSLD